MSHAAAERPAISRALGVPETNSSGFTAACHTNASAAEAAWHALEAHGRLTAYQRYSWCAAWYANVSPAIAETPAIIVVSDRLGRPAALLPLGVQTQFGLRIARFCGGKHANLAMGLYDPNAKLTARQLRRLLKTVARTAGIDLFEFLNQPVSYDGFDNPLAAGGAESPGHVHKLKLSRTGEDLLKARVSREARSKLKRKERRLAEFGIVDYRQARDNAEAARLADAFISQKSAWFKLQGIANPFSAPEMRGFLLAAAKPAGPGANPAITMFGAFAGERIVAAYGAALTADRFSGMFSSFDGDPVFSKYSPGDLLLYQLIGMMADSGRRTFDLGIGDARYKSHYCDGADRLADSTLPITMKGRVASLAMVSARRAKAVIKQSPKVFALLTGLRKRLAG